MKEQTEKNLWEAFAGESQANRKYLAFAKQAESEGYTQAAKLFRAAAHSETVHALRHLKLLDGVGDTAENLGAAIDGESYEFLTMYPAFEADADAEGLSDVAQEINDTLRVEEEHAALYRQALEALGNNDPVEYYVCGNCGHVHVNMAPEKCPVCGYPQKWFGKVE